MASVKIYNLQGQETGTMDLDTTLFGVEVRSTLVHEAVVAHTSNVRAVLAHTKDRSEVAGGNKKPWKQKGTGRARHGSRQSPIWKGGGITFGPTNLRNFAVKINKKTKRLALAMVLSDKVNHDRLIVVDGFRFDDGKTKELSKSLALLPSAGKKTLVVVEMDNRGVGLAARNLKNVEVFPVNTINLLALLRLDYVVFTKVALEAAMAIYKR